MEIFDRSKLLLPAGAGFDQDRFLRPRQRLSGCGPTTAAALAYYLDPQASKATTNGLRSLALMDDMWTRMPPTLLGLFNPWRFRRAFLRAMAEKGLALEGRVVPVVGRSRRPHEVRALVGQSLAQDIPVPFLHLYGQNPWLDTWHWMTIAGLEDGPDGRQALIFDNGRFYETDIVRWLEKGPAFGAFVCFSFANR